MRVALGTLVTAGLVVAGSGAAGAGARTARPADSSGASIKACFMVSDVGVDDHGFNEEGWTALQEAHANLGVQIKYLAESGSITYTTIGSEFISEGCNFIVGEGFDTADEIQTLATANPTVKFALIDDTLSASLPNVAELYYHTDEGAFLGGYIAAASSKSKIVGMFGNEPIPPVLLYMNGFVAGVNYYNTLNHASVKLIGYNPVTHSGEFMNSFSSTSANTQITNSELAQGADVIYGVGLPNTTAEAVHKYGHGAAAIGVDTDGCVSYPELCPEFLTSVEKNITPTLYRVLDSDVKGKFDSGIFNGTLRNNGVGLAPYHDWSSRVPAAAQAEVQTLKRDILRGKINYDPYST
jgi:basic membrane protein A